MPLALEPRSGEFVPYVKFNGKAGRWFTKNDQGNEVEVQKLTAVFDLAHIKVGWIWFVENGAPDHVWDQGGTKMVQPSTNHKRGFSVNIFSQNALGGVREFSANSNTACLAINELYDQYENAPEAAKGMLPVVKCDEAIPVKSKFGVNYQPKFTITKWVPRPEPLADALKINGSGNGSATVAAPESARPTVVPPPISGKDEDLFTAAAEEEEEF